jgi:hypothetical protein
MILLVISLLMMLQSTKVLAEIVLEDRFESDSSLEWTVVNNQGSLHIRSGNEPGSGVLQIQPQQTYLHLAREFPEVFLKPGMELEITFSLRVLESPPDNWAGFRFGLYAPQKKTGYYATLGSGESGGYHLYEASDEKSFFQSSAERLQTGHTRLGGGVQTGSVYHICMRLTVYEDLRSSIGLLITAGERAGSVFYSFEQPAAAVFSRLLIGCGGISVPFELDDVLVQTRHGASVMEAAQGKDALSGVLSSIVPSSNRLSEFSAMLCADKAAGTRIGLGVPVENRGVWTALAETEAAPEIIKKAEQFLNDDWQARSQTLFELQKKTDRSLLRTYYDTRHKRLFALTVAECLEDRGRFLPELNAMLSSLASEGTWISPWSSLSDSSWTDTPQTIDLGSAMLSSEVAIALYWLNSRLDPDVVKQLDLALRRHMLEPVRAALEDGHALHRFDWHLFRNNWNSVCLYGVLSAALAVPLEAEERAFYLGMTELSIQYFLAGYEEDGFYGEGFSYWNYGFSRFLAVHELMRRATGGAVDLLAQPKARIAGSYPLLSRVADGIYAGFGDDEPGAALNEGAMSFFLRRCGEPYDVTRLGLEAFGSNNTYLYYSALFVHPLDPADPVRHPLLTQIDRMRQVLPSGQLYVFRPGESSVEFGAYIKFGHNGLPHNHNDIGTYGIGFSDGSMPVYDVGKMVYTSETFGKSRYSLDVHTSFGHPVPLVAGTQQGTGRLFSARILGEEFTEAADRVTADLTGAYLCPALLQLIRTVEYSRMDQGRFTVTDQVHYNADSMFETAITTFGVVEVTSADTLRISEGKKELVVNISAGNEPFRIEITDIPQKLSHRKPGKRIGIVLTEPVREARVSVSFTPAE